MPRVTLYVSPRPYVPGPKTDFQPVDGAPWMASSCEESELRGEGTVGGQASERRADISPPPRFLSLSGAPAQTCHRAVGIDPHTVEGFQLVVDRDAGVADAVHPCRCDADYDSLTARLLQFIKDGDMAHANHNSLVQANSVLSRTQAQGLRLPSTTVALLTSVVKAVVGSDIAGLGPDGIVSTETRTI